MLSVELLHHGSFDPTDDEACQELRQAVERDGASKEEMRRVEIMLGNMEEAIYDPLHSATKTSCMLYCVRIEGELHMEGLWHTSPGERAQLCDAALGQAVAEAAERYS